MRQEYRNEIHRTPNLTNLYQNESLGEKYLFVNQMERKTSGGHGGLIQVMSSDLMTFITSNYHWVSFYTLIKAPVLEKIHLGCIP